MRGVEHPVQRQGELDGAEVGAEVAAGAGHRRDQELADLLRRGRPAADGRAAAGPGVRGSTPAAHGGAPLDRRVVQSDGRSPRRPSQPARTVARAAPPRPGPRPAGCGPGGRPPARTPPRRPPRSPGRPRRAARPGPSPGPRRAASTPACTWWAANRASTTGCRRSTSCAPVVRRAQVEQPGGRRALPVRGVRRADLLRPAGRYDWPAHGHHPRQPAVECAVSGGRTAGTGSPGRG